MPDVEIEDYTQKDKPSETRPDSEDLDKDGNTMEAQETAIAESKESLEKESREKFEGDKHDRALEVAEKTNKKMAMKFGANWCIKCKEMDKDTWSDKEVSEFMKENNVFMGINVDNNPELAKKYGVKGLPVTLIGEVQEVTDENREALKDAPQSIVGDTTYAFIVSSRVDGYMNAEDMLKELQKK